MKVRKVFGDGPSNGDFVHRTPVSFFGIRHGFSLTPSHGPLELSNEPVGE
jgi:hypothetical protein